MAKLLFPAFLLVASLLPVMAQDAEAYSGTVMAEEGAWCWFADPRALHYENEAGTINASYIGYIDVHGNVKATQYDWLTKRKTDVLVRSYFQPDDHNNPTFVVLPDERVMIFYTRHTDEPKIWYRISQKPGDITALGDEKYLTTANNTTYPSPFILSDDPNHIYLCWRGINWHPTIARITMPDGNDNCQFDFGPKQIVQSTGARPYAKYQSNGKDRIYVSYTTGHPDNEMPDWLYFNVIDINHGDGPVLRDMNGKLLSVINNGVFNVNKTDSYASSYPATIVDRTANVRNWVWQIALDKDENPVIAYPHIDNAKTSHVYWYARWTGLAWQNTRVQDGGHAFHQNWNSTERCYSGGMAIDPDNVNDLYLSIPTQDGGYNKDGVYEIWKYTIGEDGQVAGSEQVTKNSEKNNMRPFILPGSKNSKMRLVWMNGDYYYWMVKQGYPKGYPTSIRCDYAWEEQLTPQMENAPQKDRFCLCKDNTLSFVFHTSGAWKNYTGTLLSNGSDCSYAIGEDYYPVFTIGGKSYKSQNRLLTSDNWATQSNGTNGDNHPTELPMWVLTMTYDGKVMTTYRNGLVDQVIEVEGLNDIVFNGNGENYGQGLWVTEEFYACASPLTVQERVKNLQAEYKKQEYQQALQHIQLPQETRADLVLPKTMLNNQVNVVWKSSDEDIITSDGVLMPLKKDADVELTASIGEKSRTFKVKALARDIEKNLLYSKEELDLTGNTAGGWNSNRYEVAPEGLLKDLRSFTFLVTINAKNLAKAPRIYDFGSGSGNSLFLRAAPLSAGVKYNGGTTTMVNSSTTLNTGQKYKLAVSYDAATKLTTIYVDGEVSTSGMANLVEAYQLEQLSGDARNYIGRTQWWDSNYAADNVDFVGKIDQFRMYNLCLTRKEICELQGIPFEVAELPGDLQNGDFEGTYTVLPGSGVSSNRAIYVPEGWTVDYSVRNENDFNAFKGGDLLYDQFFAAKPQNAEGDKQTLWVRQRWGQSSIGFYQDVKLAAGRYTLSADIYASDISDGTYVYVNKVQKMVSTAHAWETVSIDFNADAEESFRVGCQTLHLDSEGERICAFDNFRLALMEEEPDAIRQPSAKNASRAYYSLSGARRSFPLPGVNIVKESDGKHQKVLVW